MGYALCRLPGIVASGSWHLWYPELSFAMLGGSTLASWKSLERHLDARVHNEGHVENTFELSLTFGRFHVRWTRKGMFVHACLQVCLLVCLGNRISMSGIGRTSIWQGMFCKNLLSRKFDCLWACRPCFHDLGWPWNQFSWLLLPWNWFEI